MATIGEVMVLGSPLLPGVEATPERVSLLWLLASFVLTTATTRTLTRYIRHRADRAPGVRHGGPIRDVLINGVHIHHQVWGILLILLVGFLQVAYRPDGAWAHVAAAAFGAGAALTLDQFAMWLHLEDVYWSPEGRTSVTALLVALLVAVALLLGTDPLGLAVRATGAGSARWVGAGVMLLNLVTSVVCLLKGKPWLAVVGVFVPVLGWGAAVRLARPGSRWAQTFYDPAGRRAALSRRRAERHATRWNRFVDLIGGPPSRDPGRGRDR